MKLLIITQTLDKDDSNLGFFHKWIEEFAKYTESVEVICLLEGEHSLPSNVCVHSLGKEEGTSRLTRVVRFYQYIFKLKKKYDAVFVHMNPEYVVLGGYWWKRWNKKMGLWYAHRSNTAKLRQAVRLTDYVFTVSQDSFAVPTPKLRVVGHGIDTDLFKPSMREGSTQLRTATVGRLSSSKHLLEMLEVLDELERRGKAFVFSIAGEATTPAEEQYAMQVRAEVMRRPYHRRVRFMGAIPHDALPTFLNGQDIFFNFATTGNMDKAGLEALAVGVPVFATNRAFEALLGPYYLYVDTTDAGQIANAIDACMNRHDWTSVAAILRNKIVKEHSLSELIPKILKNLK